MAQHQRTLAETVELEGVGLHSGRRTHVRIHPATEGSGLSFVRVDRQGATLPAAARLLNGSSLSTTLSRGADSVATVEHVLSALAGLGVDNARIEVDGPEIPILDGSALPFIETIQRAGLRAQSALRRFVTLTRPVRVRDGDKEILALPANDLEISYAIDFPHPAIGYQAVTARIDAATYAREIAPARTFCLLRDVDEMRRSGLARGGSLDNAIVVAENGVMNGSLRFEDEFVRHKILDLIGDLALLGNPLRAHVIAFKGGHRLHGQLVRRILASRGAWVTRTSEVRLPAAEVAAFTHLKDRVLPHPARVAV